VAETDELAAASHMLAERAFQIERAEFCRFSHFSQYPLPSNHFHARIEGGKHACSEEYQVLSQDLSD
jgi:hypothetical protein